MATFELDDAVVRRFVEGAQTLDWLPAAELGEALEKQLPQPEPTGVGAVVRLANDWIAVRSDTGDLGNPWRLLTPSGQYEGWRPDLSDYGPFEVLSPGVEL